VEVSRDDHQAHADIDAGRVFCSLRKGDLGAVGAG
jgi:hypothetical protein